MAKSFEAACQRCKKCVREDEVERDGKALLSNVEQEENFAGECLEDEVEARASTCEESLVDTTSLQMHDEEQQPPPQEPMTATITPDDKVLVAGMHTAPKKKKGRAGVTGNAFQPSKL